MSLTSVRYTLFSHCNCMGDRTLHLACAKHMDMLHALLTNTYNIYPHSTQLIIIYIIICLRNCLSTLSSLSSATLKLLYSNLSVYCVYRAPPATTKTHKSVPFTIFLSKLDSSLTVAATNHNEFLITGEFNLHLDKPDDSQVRQFLSALNSTNVTQHVSILAHRDHRICICSWLHQSNTTCFFPTHRDHHISICSRLH